MTTLRNIGLGRLASAILLAIAGLALADSSAWRGARFPGFFVMPNRVVPSVGLPGRSEDPDRGTKDPTSPRRLEAACARSARIGRP